jgi:phenylalanyl-tRNA synthetase beta chain
MSYKNIDRLIGKKIPNSQILDILTKLDFGIERKTDNGFTALVPPYRVEVTREADVIEEILRIYGYDNIELKEKTSSDFLAEFPEIDPDKEQLKISELLTADGYFEIITNSLTNPDYAIRSAFLDETQSIPMINKLSEDTAVLRQTLLFTGLEVLNYNISHRQKNVKIFEFGKTYKKIKGKYREQNLLSIWATGDYESENWISKSRPIHFHDFYGAVLKIINKFIQGSSNSEIFKDPVFDYGLRLVYKDHVIAKLGLLSQQVTKLVELSQKVFYAEVDVPWLLKNAQTQFGIKEIPKFPEVRRDLSLVLDKNVTFEEIRQITKGKEFARVLKDVNVFDHYVGENLEEGKKAYALSFILQDEQKTLKDKDIDKIMGRLIALYEAKIGATIRK